LVFSLVPVPVLRPLSFFAHLLTIHSSFVSRPSSLVSRSHPLPPLLIIPRLSPAPHVSSLVFHPPSSLIPSLIFLISRPSSLVSRPSSFVSCLLSSLPTCLVVRPSYNVPISRRFSLVPLVPLPRLSSLVSHQWSLVPRLSTSSLVTCLSSLVSQLLLSSLVSRPSSLNFFSRHLSIVPRLSSPVYRPSSFVPRTVLGLLFFNP
jgi:hypothetical protein